MNDVSAVNTVLHDLKNSLFICKGYLTMCHPSKLSDEKKYIDIIKKEIMNSLKQIQVYQEQKDIKETINLTTILQEVVNKMSPIIKGKIIFLENKDYYVKGNKEKFYQVFINLLKNSYEAKSKEELEIIIKMISWKDKCKVLITDNGIGMSKEELQRIGHSFYTTKKEGNGLGIFSCKEIINNCGGEISYQSRKNHGTKVIITFPKEKSPKTFNSSNY